MEIGIAKNYLIEKEINELDGFLQFNEYEVLKDAGKVSHEVAMKLARKK